MTRRLAAAAPLEEMGRRFLQFSKRFESHFLRSTRSV
jgi:hypothetical protein